MEDQENCEAHGEVTRMEGWLRSTWFEFKI